MQLVRPSNLTKKHLKVKDGKRIIQPSVRDFITFVISHQWAPKDLLIRD